MAQILVLDAMGVLYQAGDDVGELLVPFVARHGDAGLSATAIDQAYTEASLGRMTAPVLWQRLGVSPDREDDYLAGHRLIVDSHGALPALRKQFDVLACLSNDVSSWSLKLRRRFGLEKWIDEWFISGDLGVRKPSPAIYLKALERLGAASHEVTFVDDRPRNLDAARDLGIDTVLLDVAGDQHRSAHRRIRRLAELL